MNKLQKVETTFEQTFGAWHDAYWKQYKRAPDAGTVIDWIRANRDSIHYHKMLSLQRYQKETREQLDDLINSRATRGLRKLVLWIHRWYQKRLDQYTAIIDQLEDDCEELKAHL